MKKKGPPPLCKCGCGNPVMMNERTVNLLLKGLRTVRPLQRWKDGPDDTFILNFGTTTKSFSKEDVIAELKRAQAGLEAEAEMVAALLEDLELTDTE